MEYRGKLYGKIGNKYFDTDKTSDDWDNMEKRLNELESKVKENELLHSVSHCPLCDSTNLHQYKLHHIHCKNCKENFDKSCD